VAQGDAKGELTGPVVALLDTGIGQHPWFTEGVITDVSVDGIPIGLRFSPAEDPELTGCTLDRVNGLLDPLAGHGTFVAGVVRQHCPEATLMVVPVMHGDGVTDEAFLVETLSLLYVRQLLAHSQRGKGPAIDILSLSLGYYHETPGAFDDEPAFCGVLRALANTGVAVVAAAGNGGTNHEFYPAAFAVAGGFDLPLMSVGAHNPDGSTVSAFSNTGHWVRAYRCGTAVVSTMPTTFNGSLQAVLHQSGAAVPARGSCDPDDYSCGFALWSGTSFAAPAFAGDLAASLFGDGWCDDSDPDARVEALAKAMATLEEGDE
jgi:subtilisin family serine protease